MILCADDYGLSPGVGAAIRDLVRISRLSAVSCMTISASWPDEAAKLIPLADGIEVGLHLTLTDMQPLGPMPRLALSGRLPTLRKLLWQAQFSHVVRDEIRDELHRQITAFVAAFGRLPSYVDGHKHVHQMPWIGPIVLEAMNERLRPDCWVRYCDEPLWSIARRGVSPVKASVISLLGWRFSRTGRRLGRPGNRSFRGVYNLSPHSDYARLLERFSQPLDKHALIMCHPGHVDSVLQSLDAVTDARENEYAVLSDPAHWPAGLTLTRRPQ